MKRIMVVIFILTAVLSFPGCSFSEYEGWQTVNIDDCGGIKIPGEWVYYEHDGLIYITDAGQNPIMIQTNSYCGINKNPGITESNVFFESVTSLQLLSSAVYSNGAVYGKMLMQNGDTRTENYYLSIGYDRNVDLVVWDERVDIVTVKLIAQSFVCEPYNLEP